MSALFAVGSVGADFVGHWPAGDVHGVESLISMVRQTRAVLDDLVFSLDVDPVVDGDLVAARWRGVGTAGGTVSAFYGHDLLRLADGKVVEYWPATVALSG